jgi:hypothetical protein
MVVVSILLFFVLFILFYFLLCVIVVLLFSVRIIISVSKVSSVISSPCGCLYVSFSRRGFIGVMVFFILLGFRCFGGVVLLVLCRVLL